MPVLTVYKASAGAGKTFTLAVQYIKLLVEADEGGEYAHILAVTFTNKATTEMKDRIISQLYGIGHSLRASQPYFEKLCEALKKDGRGDMSEDEVRRRCRQALRQILHDYNRFRVSTIDAFFQSILRGLAHELGLTANLQVEISDTEVLSEAVDRIVDRLQDDPVLLEWIYSLVRDQIENNQKWNVTGKVKSFGRAIFNEDYLLRGDVLREVLRDEQRFGAILTEIEQLKNGAMPAVKALGQQLRQVVSDEGVDYADFSNGKDLRAFTEKLESGNMAVDVSARIRGWIEDSDSLVKKSDQKSRPQLLVSARRVSDVLESTLEAYLRFQHEYNSAQLVFSHIKSLRLLKTIDDEVATINSETSRFNLAKTPILLNRMVGESDAPFVFEKMGALLRHVMIDEFQDTSNLQWQNFRALLLESFAKGGRNLIVGDVKQSIYRWRGGDWRVLGNIETNFHPRPEVISLKENRRSDSRIVNFNNSFFSESFSIMDCISAEEEALLNESFTFADAYADVVQLVPEGRPDAGYVRVVTIDTEQLKRREQWESGIIEDMMSQIRALHAHGLPYQQMAILVRANSDSQPIIDAFARVDDMPAIVSDEAFLFSSCPAIKTLVTALRLLDDANDQVASFYIENIGASEVLADESLRTMPLYDLLETLYRRLHLDHIPGQDAYLFGFFDAVVDYVHNNASDIHSFLTYWDETLSSKSIPAGQVDGIRILTIHKAKGLEFHTVFMPFCAWAFDRDRWSNLIWCRPTEAPYDELHLLPVTPSRSMMNSAFTQDYVREHLFSRLDEMNTLYVGFTRACSNLYIWAPGRRSALGKPSRTVGDLIAAVLPDGYDVGEPVTTVEAGKRSDNRMIPDMSPEVVAMHSFPVSATFRQSNRSQQFLHSQDDIDELSMSEESRQQQYIEMGRLLHSVLQQIHTREELPRVLNILEQEGIISRTAADGTYVAVQRSAVEQWINRAMKNPVVSEWFDGSWEVFNECSIVRSNTSDGQVETLRPDRVMLSDDRGRIIVVDFKFGRPNSDYEQQVQTYMDLLKAMYPDAAVEGFLWYVYTAKVQPVHATSKEQTRASKCKASSPEPDQSQLTLDF